MKNKDKTIALSLLVLLLYALFVWYGMTYEPIYPNVLDTAITSITNNTYVPPNQTAENVNGSGPSSYLKTLGLSVYTDAEFSSIGGTGKIFSNKPKMTLFVFMPTPQGDAIVWHDGNEGYVCIDMLGLLTEQKTSLKQTYIDMCQIYDFQLYIAGNEKRSIAYAAKTATISAYKKQTGKSFDNVYGTMSLFISNVSKL